MLRIGICDDVYDARLVLRAALERAAEKRRITAAFFEFSAGENLLRWLESHAGELDLVFLDLEMGEVDGIETARRLRAADEGLQIVFVTGHADRVFDGYGVGALGYLLKPPAPRRWRKCWTGPGRRCAARWSGPMSAAAARCITASPCKRYSTFPPTGGR